MHVGFEDAADLTDDLAGGLRELSRRAVRPTSSTAEERKGASR
jgi:hypothetical protein